MFDVYYRVVIFIYINEMIELWFFMFWEFFVILGILVKSIEFYVSIIIV